MQPSAFLPQPKTQTSFRLLIFLYQLYGFLPTAIFPIRKPNGIITHKPIHTLSTVVHLIVATIQLCLVLKFHNFIFYMRDTFGRLNDTFKYCGIALAYYSICIESYVQRDAHVRFWQRFVQLQPPESSSRYGQSAAGNSQSNVLRVDRQHLIRMAGFCVMVVIVELILSPIVLHTDQALNFWMMYSWTVLMVRLRHWQYVHYVGQIETQLRTLAVCLSSVAQYSAYESTTMEKPLGSRRPLADDDCWQRFVGSRLRWAQQRYAMLYEMTQDVNTIFGWSQLANCLHTCVQLLADMYWVYWRFYNDRTFLLTRKWRRECADDKFSSIIMCVCLFRILAVLDSNSHVDRVRRSNSQPLHAAGENDRYTFECNQKVSRGSSTLGESEKLEFNPMIGHRNQPNICTYRSSLSHWRCYICR